MSTSLLQGELWFVESGWYVEFGESDRRVLVMEWGDWLVQFIAWCGWSNGWLQWSLLVGSLCLHFLECPLLSLPFPSLWVSPPESIFHVHILGTPIGNVLWFWSSHHMQDIVQCLLCWFLWGTYWVGHGWYIVVWLGWPIYVRCQWY